MFCILIMSNYFLLSLQVEAGLLIGNMDAATDILSLEGHRISHIVTVRISYFVFCNFCCHPHINCIVEIEIGIFYLSLSISLTLSQSGFCVLYFVYMLAS